MSYFDYLFYIDQYDDLSHFNEKEAYNHFVMYGRREGRVCNKEMMLWKQEKINNQINKEMKYLSKVEFKKNQNKINVLIRTSNRKACFSKCINSILDQNYENYKIIVCYDNVKSLDYLSKYKNNKNIDYFFVYNKSQARYKYNLYCNRLKNKVCDGFVLYLDDDDMLVHKNCFNVINENIIENEILIWKFFRSDKLIYPNNTNKINLGEIASCSFITNINKYYNCEWWEKRNGDYNIFCQLLKNNDNVNVKFIDFIITKNQSNDKVYNNGV